MRVLRRWRRSYLTSKCVRKKGGMSKVMMLELRHSIVFDSANFAVTQQPESIEVGLYRTLILSGK